MRTHLFAAFVLAAAGPAAASEESVRLADAFGGGPVLGERTASGTVGGAAWRARSLIVGQTSTLTLEAGGDPIYLPARPGKNGVVFLELFGTGFCSGSLMAGGTAILTAARCVTDRSGAIAATGGFAYFYPGPADPLYDLGFGVTPGIERVALGAIHVAPGYTGQVVDHNDLAVIFLAGAAPAFARPYLLERLVDPRGVAFNVAGFGDRGRSGATGFLPGTVGRLREGDNRFEFALGDPIFGGGWGGPELLARYGDVWLSDFDRVGSADNDAACILTGLVFGLGDTFCETGLGPREVGVAPGDSGGPQFVNGRIVSVSSFILTFGPDFGDVDDRLNGSWGEFSGFAPVFRNRSWIERLVPGAFVPEPGTWAMLITGFGLVGLALRRRRGDPAAA